MRRKRKRKPRIGPTPYMTRRDAKAPAGGAPSSPPLSSHTPRCPPWGGHSPPSPTPSSPRNFPTRGRARPRRTGLRRVRLTYGGFDRHAHAGALVANEGAVRDLVHVFARLYATRFPIRRLRPIDAYGGNDGRSLAADNTAAFNCRYVIGPGPRRWSAHAYGEAIDVNPVENPYLEGGRVHPRAGRTYLRRSLVRPGMATPGGVLVRSFTAVGWKGGGRWAGSPDYQHFSATIG